MSEKQTEGNGPFKLASATVVGFLGTKEFTLKFNDDVTFLIGENGSGKTQFIRLLHASLAMNLKVLAASSFESIVVRFRANGKRRQPSLTIEKAQGGETTVLKISSELKQRREFTLGAPAAATRKPTARPGSLGDLWLPTLAAATLDAPFDVIGNSRNITETRKELEELCPFAWLPLQRQTDEGEHLFFKESTEQPVDKKLSSIESALGRHLSLLDSRYGSELEIFQREYFMSFLQTKYSEPPAKFINAKFDIDKDRSSIRDILNAFRIPPQNYEPSVVSFFDELKSTRDRTEKSGPTTAFWDAVRFFDAYRLHELIEKWQALQSTRNRIYRAKSLFENVLSDLFRRKSVSFDETNTIQVVSDSGQRIMLADLSSGEKQMLILLSETFLREDQIFLYIADEPELSLHIAWQTTLVDNVRSLNPAVQIVFATHSPDIVGSYQDKVFDFGVIW